MVLVGIFLYLMLGTSAAFPQDLSGKMFTFPEETNTAHVRIATSRTHLNAVTVCLRSFTELTRKHALFSLATPSSFNSFVLFRDAATTGLAQVWINGKPSSRKFVSTSDISGPIVIVLGQEQDSLGGSFEISESFVGMMADVHMWDYVLTPCQIQSYSNKRRAPNGNVLNWNSLEFQTSGRVLIEDNQEQC